MWKVNVMPAELSDRPQRSFSLTGAAADLMEDQDSNEILAPSSDPPAALACSWTLAAHLSSAWPDLNHGRSTRVDVGSEGSLALDSLAAGIALSSPRLARRTTHVTYANNATNPTMATVEYES